MRGNYHAAHSPWFVCLDYDRAVDVIVGERAADQRRAGCGLSAATSSDRSTPPDQPAAPTASGPSMYLNGASYVNVPNASLPAIGSGDFTLEAWIYPTNVTGFHAVLAKWYAAGFWFGIVQRQAALLSRQHARLSKAPPPFPINRWTHIAVYSYYDALRQRLFRRVLSSTATLTGSTCTPARPRSAARMICTSATIKTSNTSSATLPKPASGTAHAARESTAP